MWRLQRYPDYAAYDKKPVGVLWGALGEFSVFTWLLHRGSSDQQMVSLGIEQSSYYL